MVVRCAVRVVGGGVTAERERVCAVVSTRQHRQALTRHKSTKIGDVVDTDMEPYRGPTGQVTTLNESIFTTIPGAPAWVAKATKYDRKSSQWGLKDLNLQNHNAIQGSFRFQC